MTPTRFRRRWRKKAHSWQWLATFALALVLLAPLAFPGRATAPGPLRVVDGDTLDLGEERLRILNIDTPEAGSLARCPSERARAAAASAHARRLLREAAPVEVERQGLDRYGRTLVRVRLADGRDFGAAMIAAGHARPWRGRREPWCGPGE